MSKNLVTTANITWAGATESALINCRGKAIVGISFENNVAINAETVGFKIYHKEDGSVGGFPMQLLDNSGAYTITSAQATYLPLDPALFAGLEYIGVTLVGTPTGTLAKLHLRDLNSDI